MATLLRCFRSLAIVLVFGLLLGARAEAARVLLLADTPAGGTPALITALQAAGHSVKEFAPESDFNGANVPLAGFDAVVHLAGFRDGLLPPMPVAGQVALQQFVNNGGGYIGAQWMGWYESQRHERVNMPDLVLLSYAGAIGSSIGQLCGACNISYSTASGQSTHPVLDGIPVSFTFFADAHDASPKKFPVNPPTVLMTIPTGAPGVQVRQVGTGRVVFFSFAPNDSSAQMLLNPIIQRLYTNAVAWAAHRNSPPTAVIAPLGAVHVGSLVTLDGSGSTDPDGNSLTYHWTLSPPAGSSAMLSDPSAVMPTFTADRTGTYDVQLVVNDGTQDSPLALASLSSENGAPVADAGPDQLLILDGTLVHLDGSASDDPDSDPLTYAWTLTSKPASSAAALDLPGSAAPSFVADINGEYVLQLVVTDPFGASSADSVTVSFNNLPPMADAESDQSVVVGSAVTLPGGGSDPNGDPLTFHWSLLSAPAGSAAALTGSSTATAGFTVDKSGLYVAQLIVNDGIVYGTPDTVSIQVISAQDAATLTLQELIAYINGLPSKDGSGHNIFKHLHLKKALAHKLMAALELIEHGKIRPALSLLQHNVKRELDGCTLGGASDFNDWIVTCAEQTHAYTLLSEAILYLDEVPPGQRPRHDRHFRHGSKGWEDADRNHDRDGDKDRDRRGRR